VRRGSATRRCLVYGALQAAFTLATLALFAGVVYRSFALQLLWQAAKVLVPLYYGAQYQCEALPRYQFLEGLRRLQQLEAAAAQQQQGASSGAGPVAAEPQAQPAAAAASVAASVSAHAGGAPGRRPRSRSARRRG
jgi:hypothetical protein